MGDDSGGDTAEAGKTLSINDFWRSHLDDNRPPRERYVFLYYSVLFYVGYVRMIGCISGWLR